MTNDELKEIIGIYADKYGVDPVGIEKNLSETSIDDSDKDRAVYIYNPEHMKDVRVISWDAFAQNIYRRIRYPESKAERDSVSSPDAVFIDRAGIWYFIEFKNQKLTKTSSSVRAKMVEAWHEFMDMLFDTRPASIDEVFFQHPIEYARQNVVFILVVGDKYSDDVAHIQDKDRAGEKYTPEFMYKLKRYYFKDAYAYTAELLEKRLVSLG